MSQTDRPRPSLELLNQYAEDFNKSSALRQFSATLSFPSQSLLRIDMEVRPEFRGGLGDANLVNGLVLSALFDLSIGCTSALIDPTRRSATMQLSMSFERPVSGQRIHSEAELTQAGGKTAFAVARIYDEAGNVCSRCQGVLRISSLPWREGEASPF